MSQAPWRSQKNCDPAIKVGYNSKFAIKLRSPPVFHVRSAERSQLLFNRQTRTKHWFPTQTDLERYNFISHLQFKLNKNIEMVECKTSFECWTWNCSCYAHNYSWTRKKQPKHSTRNNPRKTDDFVPIVRKQGINSWRSDQETRTVGDFLTDTRKAGSPPQRFFFSGVKSYAKSLSSLQRRTNKNENCCRNWFLAPEKLGHCFWWEWSTH